MYVQSDLKDTPLQANLAVENSRERPVDRNRSTSRQWHLNVSLFTMYSIWKKRTLCYCYESGHHAGHETAAVLILYTGNEHLSHPRQKAAFLGEDWRKMGLSEVYPLVPRRWFWEWLWALESSSGTGPEKVDPQLFGSDSICLTLHKFLASWQNATAQNRNKWSVKMICSS